MAIEKNIRITADTSQATESIKGLGNEIDKTTEKVETQRDQWEVLLGLLTK